MAIPVNAMDLIYSQRVESPRLEFKKGWNPEKILHTMCAFANDIDEWGGGYIVVGVDMNSGEPKITGLDKTSLDDIQKELMGISNLLEPRYLPSTEIVDIDDKTILIIWVTTGDRRPYSCPINYSKDRKNNERGYYIRKMSSTIRANRDDERTLYGISRNKSFDVCLNYDASIQDLKNSLITEYLYRVKSSLYIKSKNETLESLCKDMRIIGGPPENPRPLNVGVLFFTDRPDLYIDHSYIDIVDKPDPTGNGMEEYHITGPLDKQIMDALSIIKNRFIRERIYKSDSGPEAKRIVSYPYIAVRELLVNAAFHKNYEIYAPVTVTITPTSMEFLNYPGPNHSLSDDDIRNNRLNAGTYRNSRIGEYLKELDLAESRFTGIPQVIRALEENGSPPLKIITDVGRTYFKAILEIHPEFKTGFNPSNAGPLSERIVGVLGSRGCMTATELAIALGYKGMNKGLREELSALMSEGIIEYLYPDKPRSPKQRICLSDRKRGTGDRNA